MGENFKEDFSSSQKSIKNYFGGFYEMTFFLEKSFCKLSHYFIMSWRYDEELHFISIVQPLYIENELYFDIAWFDDPTTFRTEQLKAKSLFTSKHNIPYIEYPILLNINFFVDKNLTIQGIKHIFSLDVNLNTKIRITKEKLEIPGEIIHKIKNMINKEK